MRFIQLGRRKFITLFGGAAVTWPLAARAQQERDPNINIGVLTDMSGLFATLAGEGSVVAAHMAVEDFGGEALGREIRVLFADHKHNVDVASGIATHWFNEAHVGAVVDSAYMRFVEPMCCYSRGDIDVVFVVGEEHADFPTEGLTAEIFDSHMGGNDRALTG